jgi:chemotaxis protein CheZ
LKKWARHEELHMTADNDSPDLEALFDSVAAATQTRQPAVADSPSQATAPKKYTGKKPSAANAPSSPPTAPVTEPAAQGDSDDLQALFDSVAAESRVAAASPATPDATSAPVAGDEWPTQSSVFNRIGQMARQLHNTLHELGYDKLLEKTISNTLPDAKDRLAYVANLTEQAACRVLNATDVAKPIIDGLENDARVLGERWDKAFANQLSTAEFRQLAEDTRTCLKSGIPGKTGQVNAQILEIMMAQDFQDLTGQVIKKIVSLAQDLENGLMKALIDVVPQSKRSEEITNLMNGPVIHAEGRSDVVVNQQQVDDLLDSLGF